MDSHDCLRVNNFLQVDGQTDIYAVGDCCNADELNTAHFAELHANVVAKNIQLGVAGKNYVSYKPGDVDFLFFCCFVCLLLPLLFLYVYQFDIVT